MQVMTLLKVEATVNTTMASECARTAAAPGWRGRRGLAIVAVVAAAVGLSLVARATWADDDPPRRPADDEVMRRLDRISAGLERLLERMGPPEGRGPREDGRPGGGRRDGDMERRPEPGRPDGPPREGGPRPPWGPPGPPPPEGQPRPEGPPPSEGRSLDMRPRHGMPMPGRPERAHEMRERIEHMMGERMEQVTREHKEMEQGMREARERMQDGFRRMEEARERFESMERRVKELEEQVERLKKAHVERPRGERERE
jgi:hypothetical protein